VVHRQDWGEDRVHLHDENGVLFSLPAAWTDVAVLDPFVVIAGYFAERRAAGYVNERTSRALQPLLGYLQAPPPQT